MAAAISVALFLGDRRLHRRQPGWMSIGIMSAVWHYFAFNGAQVRRCGVAQKGIKLALISHGVTPVVMHEEDYGAASAEQAQGRNWATP